MISPSWISLCENDILGFINSIIPGLISCEMRELEPCVSVTPKAHLVKLDGRSWCPPHSFVDERREVADLVHPTNINLSNSCQRLLRRVEMLEEDHDVLGRRGLWLCGVGDHVEIKAKVHLANSHLVANDIDR